MSGRDVLDMNFDEITIPQAIAVTLGAATKCVSSGVKDDYPVVVDEERLRELMDKLEARVQDALDNAVATVEPTLGDAPDEEPVEFSDVVLLEDGAVLNVKGVIYQKACNKPVFASENGSVNTYCIKRWEHMSTVCEDKYGEERFT